MSVKIEKIIIPTYPEPPLEELPMFAQAREHQRTSGNPYPQKIILKVDRTQKTDKEYTSIILENDFIKLTILPELGGRIYSAFDKRTNYDFVYKNNVIKPAIIGCLGSWISGGMEFNWPFHHRPSTFMPVDYEIREDDDGTCFVFLSEHEPMSRMKGMVCVILRPDRAYFETRARLYNRTDTTKSFLWWENTAVAVNKDYQIFFPPDVEYVNFHYKLSVTTYPVADNSLGIFNGIRFDEPTDISMHKNTIQPTSYFCAPSKYDFFGGYDHGKRCGTVHIADHNIAVGKKMFTWGYNQLSKSWENALTDEDGAYAELMAGVYSDNQPDFAFLEPYETKEFSQFWYPIGSVGVPLYANLNGAISNGKDSEIKLQLTKRVKNATFKHIRKGTVLKKLSFDLACGEILTVSDICTEISDEICISENNEILLDFVFEKKNEYNIPETTSDLPCADEAKSADELYLEGVHVKQYRDPAIKPDYYWKKALERQNDHAASLISLGELAIEELDFDLAKSYLEKAEKSLTRFNKHPQSGKLYYLLAVALFAKGEKESAYNYFYKSSWNLDYLSASMTRIGAMDIANKEYTSALAHLETALEHNVRNFKAASFYAIALLKLGRADEAEKICRKVLAKDPLEHFARFVLVLANKSDKVEFLKPMHSDICETILDIISDLEYAGLSKEIEIAAALPNEKSAMLNYVSGNIKDAESGMLGRAFPSRKIELDAFKKAINNGAAMAHYYLGCILYANRHYEEGAKNFELACEKMPDFYPPYRCLAVAFYSHLNKKQEAKELLQKALELSNKNEQLIYELAVINDNPKENIKLICENKTTRDDICIELAKAYNKSALYNEALKTLSDHTFIACEGGEHAIADEYMFAHHALGRIALKNGDFKCALSHFNSALVLPQSLGTGIWNEAKYVPHLFFKAKTLQALSENKKADEIYSHILKLKKDYFSDLFLRSLPYYQAEAHEHFGNHLAARACIDAAWKEWKEQRNIDNAGFFTQTPFFISYIGNPKEEREAFYDSLLGYAELFAGNYEKAKRLFQNGSDPYGKLFVD